MLLRKFAQERRRGPSCQPGHFWEAIRWLTLVSEICYALIKVRAKISSKSPKPLSVFWGRPQESSSVDFPGTRLSLPGPATRLLCPSHRGGPNPRSAASGASVVERSEKAATLGSGPQEGDTARTPRPHLWCLCPCKEGSTSSGLQPNSKPTFPPAAPSGPTSLQPARARNADCRPFQTPGSNLNTPGPEWLPGWRSCHKLPRPLSPPLLPTSRAGGGRRKAQMDRGRMLSLTCDPAGERFHSPAYSARPRGAQRGSPFPRVLPSVFSIPLFSSQRGSTDDLKEFVQPGSVGQVCVRVSTPRERTNGIFKSPVPGALPHSPGHPSGSGRAREKELGRPLSPGAHERGAESPQRRAPRVGGRYGEV